jgi:hypothetical protein
MTLFQIIDTHPFASGLAVGMMLTFGTMLLSALFVRLLIKARNTPGSVALSNEASNHSNHTTRAISAAAPDSSSIALSDDALPVVGLHQ